MQKVSFYVLTSRGDSIGATPLDGVSIVVQRPGVLKWLSTNRTSILPGLVWTGFHYGRIFANRDYASVIITFQQQVVHRTVIFPRYFRFPFMSKDDLQLGQIWTHPKFRGMGLAKLGVSAALRYACKPNRRIWYLTDTCNSVSRTLAERSGFRFWGEGVRTRPFGLSIFGQFLVTDEVGNVR